MSGVEDPPPDPPDPPNTSTQASASTLGATGGTVDTQSLSPNSSSSTPPWLRWSRSLNALLDDSQGQELFKTYLEQEGCDNQLTFLWACEGLKCTAADDPPKIPDLVRKIYHYFVGKLIGLSDSTRSDLAQAIVDGRFTDTAIFNNAEEEVLTHMREHLYPNFLKSDVYLAAVNGEEPQTSSSASTRERRQSEGGDSDVLPIDESKSVIDPVTGLPLEQSSPKIPSPPLSTRASVQEILLPNKLQTVHEDTELSMNMNRTPGPTMKLTKDALLATQLSRASDIPGVTKSRKSEPMLGHYFNKSPTSSGAVVFPYHAKYSSYNPVSRKDSEIQSMSSGAMTDDGGHGNGGGKHGKYRGGHKKEGRSYPGISGIPAGAVLGNTDNLPRVEAVKHPEGNKASLAESNPAAFAQQLIAKLEIVSAFNDVDERFRKRMIMDPTDRPTGRNIGVGGTVLAQALTKLQNSKSLESEDNPSDILDKHMSRVFTDITPTSRSPKPRSPPINRRRGGLASVRRKDKDSTSLLSADSGNLHDYPSESSLVGMHKSRSIPYNIKMHQEHDPSHSLHLPGHQNIRYTRGGVSNPGPLCKAVKKSTSDFVDSGVSVLSGATPTPIPVWPPVNYPPLHEIPPKERRIREWMDQCGGSQISPAAKLQTSPPSQRRHPKKPLSSMEQTICHKLEEVRKMITPVAPTSLATSAEEPNSNNSDFVSSIVVYDDDKTPFALKIRRRFGRDSGITLSTFKEHLPKRGSFRYFFKTHCPELDSQVVQMEVVEDSQELPLHDGRIYAQLQTIPTAPSSIHDK